MPTSLNTNGLYTVRPSIMMIIFLAATAAKPRAVMEPRAGVEARDVDAVGKSDGIGQRRHTGAADILSRHDRNHCRRGCHWLRAPRGQRHIDLHQLLDGQPLEVLRRRFRCSERQRRNDVMAKVTACRMRCGSMVIDSGAQQ
jgi:hypothetical protein